MLSGGLDSTGAFWQLTMNSQEEIHVHHMNLRNIERRARAESIAIQGILAFMEKAGAKFTYTESTHEYPAFEGGFIWDADITSFMAGNICYTNPSIKHVALGLTKTDTAREEVSGRIKRANQIFSALCDATKIYPIEHLDKKSVYNMLPEELRRLTWSCRTPVYQQFSIIPCGKCHTCNEMKQVMS
jgi:7-cyano-7-deazaguanine synthase in queuosine biosynthesis